jgi:hypothetical protein
LKLFAKLGHHVFTPVDTLKDFLGRGQVEGINSTSLALLASSINKNVSLKVMTCTKSSYML